MVTLQKEEVNNMGTDMKWEGDLDEKLALMLEYE